MVKLTVQDGELLNFLFEEAIYLIGALKESYYSNKTVFRYMYNSDSVYTGCLKNGDLFQIATIPV